MNAIEAVASRLYHRSLIQENPAAETAAITSSFRSRFPGAGLTMTFSAASSGC